MKNIIIFLFFTPIFWVKAADWPHWLGPNRNGVSVEQDWKADLENLLWKKKVGVGFSSMVVADNRVFTLGHNGKKPCPVSMQKPVNSFGRPPTLLPLSTISTKEVLAPLLR
jgi:hypothetical protein